MTLEFKIEGLDGLVDKFTKLSDDMQRKIAWRGAAAGAKVIQQKAQKNAMAIDAPARPGEQDSKIYPSIAIQRGSKLAKTIPGGGAAYRIGVRGGASGTVRDPPTYWRYVEFGTQKTQAQPFLRPAIEEGAQAATEAVVANLWENINKEISR